MSVHEKIHWWVPTVMVSSLLAGVMLCVGHHLFYKSLMHKPASVSHTIAGIEFEGQELNIAVGTAFAVLAKASFVLAVSTSFYQLFWRHVKRNVNSKNPPTLGRVDTLLDGLNDIFALLTAPAWYRNPLMFLMAASTWLLPIASIVTPATLSVSVRENIANSSMRHVPQVDFANLKFLQTMDNPGLGLQANENSVSSYVYQGPSQDLKNIALRVAMQSDVLPINPPFPNLNSSWEVDFKGPSLKCDPIDDETREEFKRNIAEFLAYEKNCLEPATLLAWYPRTIPGENYGDPYVYYNNPYLLEGTGKYANWTYTPEDIYNDGVRNPRDYDEQDAKINIVVMPKILDEKEPFYCDKDFKDGKWSADNPEPMIGSTIHMLQCQMHNSTYNSVIRYVNGLQRINTTITELGPPVTIVNQVNAPLAKGRATDDCTTFNIIKPEPGGIDDVYCEYDDTLLPHLAYQSTMHAFTKLITGDITRSQRNIKSTSMIRSTALVNTKELEYLKDDTIVIPDDPTRDDDFPTWPTLEETLKGSRVHSGVFKPQKSNQSLADALEAMFHNITVSLMGAAQFQPNYSSPDAPQKVQVTDRLAQAVYRYKEENLWAAYGASIFVSLIFVILGLLAIISSRVSYSNSFSTIFRMAKSADLSVEIKDPDLDGKSPLPKYLAEATIQPRHRRKDAALRDIMRGKKDGVKATIVRVATFGTESPVSTPGGGTPRLQTPVARTPPAPPAPPFPPSPLRTPSFPQDPPPPNPTSQPSPQLPSPQLPSPMQIPPRQAPRSQPDSPISPLAQSPGTQSPRVQFTRPGPQQTN